MVEAPSAPTVYAPLATAPAAPEPTAPVSTDRPERPPEALTAQLAAVLRQAVVPQSAEREGAVLSMPIVSLRQSEALPATSTERVSSVWLPSVVIATLGVVTVAPP